MCNKVFLEYNAVVCFCISTKIPKGILPSQQKVSMHISCEKMSLKVQLRSHHVQIFFLQPNQLTLKTIILPNPIKSYSLSRSKKAKEDIKPCNVVILWGTYQNLQTEPCCAFWTRNLLVNNQQRDPVAAETAISREWLQTVYLGTLYSNIINQYKERNICKTNFFLVQQKNTCILRHFKQ